MYAAGGTPCAHLQQQTLLLCNRECTYLSRITFLPASQAIVAKACSLWIVVLAAGFIYVVYNSERVAACVGLHNKGRPAAVKVRGVRGRFREKKRKTEKQHPRVRSFSQNR